MITLSVILNRASKRVRSDKFEFDLVKYNFETYQTKLGCKICDSYSVFAELGQFGMTNIFFE